MRKSKLAIGLMSALLSVGALAACSDVTYSPEGVILTYTGEDGTVINYTADDLYNDEFKDASNYQTVFDAVYKIIVKNYFTETDPDNSEYGSKQLAGLKTKAQVAVDGDKQTASKKAESNGTSYDTEFSAILKDKGCEDESELFDHYLYQYEEETFNDNFEKIDKNMSILKNGVPGDDPFYSDIPWDGYFKEKVPYHVSHILVKIEDADSTNYANAVISSANAKKLNTVADALAKNVYSSFAETASLSDDSATRGDLGLVDMDKTATYIDEFKFAMYAYENLYGKKAEAQASKISMTFDADLIKNYNEVSHLEEDTLGGTPTDGFATIPFGAFTILDSNAERELGYKDQKVNDGDSDFYPRNVFFNHYFNRHSFALVTPLKAGKTYDKYFDKITDATYTKDEVSYLGTEEGMNVEGTGFHTFSSADGVNFTGTFLATSVKLGNKVVYRPILVVRGGSAGEGGYQGIHFIVVNRSPFEYVNGDTADASVASLENYYTTYFPSQDRYPTYQDGDKSVKLQTYVNFSGNKDTYQSRAGEVLSAIKGYDSEGLKHFMFRKYMKAGKLAFQDEEFAKQFYTWMTRSEQNKDYNEKVEWENKWITYIENLKQATSIQAKKTISLTCAIGFSLDHSADADWNNVGGLCNDGKQHN